MPTYHYVRDEATGESRMVLVNKNQPPAEGVPVPDTIPEVNSAELKEVHRCTACQPPQDYAIAALAAKHFRNEHEDLNEDKDSWREYVEKAEVVL